MRRISHGATTPPSNKSNEQVLQELGSVREKFHFPLATKPEKNPLFVRMFSDFANDKKCLIPETDETLQTLSELGEAMRDKQFDSEFDSRDIPSIYSYFAQFVNHDINQTDVTKQKMQTDFQFLDSTNLRPWSDEQIKELVSNKRAGMLELDCLYGTMQADVLPPRFLDNHEKMALGTVHQNGDRPPGKPDQFHDVVRGEPSPTLMRDRTALIGDRRNDSNVILSQLHVAFLRAHNEIVDRRNLNHEQAKQLLQKHYHWLILKDFLPAIVPQEIIDSVLAEPHYHAGDGLPFEFSVGAFRFGHSMIRRSYYYNTNFKGVNLVFLFTLMALSKNGGAPTPNEGSPTLPERWIIQWENFLKGGKNQARSFRTQMVEPLFFLIDEINLKVPGERSLAVQDLKRSYMMRIPSGQSIAEFVGAKVLTAEEIKEVSSVDEIKALEKGKMLECTPLSFYVLAEAAKAGKGKLGPLGGRIVAEVLIALIRDRPDSIIATNWRPDLGLLPGHFEMSDLLRLARVL